MVPAIRTTGGRVRGLSSKREERKVKHHLWIIVIIVIGLSSFMIGYSIPPFLEVGFGKATEEGAMSEEDLQKLYQDLYRESEQ